MGSNSSRRTYDNVSAIDILHQVASMYTTTKKPHDYGTGETYTSTEMHLVKRIAENPGITVTGLAYDYAKTKGAISQILKKLIEKDLIIQKRSTNAGDKRIFLYLTERGEALNRAHLAYDAKYASETMDMVRTRHSAEEIDIAFDVISSWLECRRIVHEQRHTQNSIQNEQQNTP